MSLLQEILECEEENVDSVISEAIELANKNAKTVEKLGFLGNGKSNSTFYGFIPLDTRIKYASFNMEDYSMQSTDFMYEFAHFIRTYNLKNKGALVHNLEFFINKYFGYPSKIKREAIFNDIAWQTTETDEEYFRALENNKIGHLKGTGAAQCTEKSALAQQILSLFGTETYYCMGCIDFGDIQEAHCFNIVKRKNDYAILDYSIPIPSYDENGTLKAYYPFVGVLSDEEFIDFISNGTIKSFYDYCMVEKQKQMSETKRIYVVGQYKIENEKKSGNSK